MPGKKNKPHWGPWTDVDWGGYGDHRQCAQRHHINEPCPSDVVGDIETDIQNARRLLAAAEKACNTKRAAECRAYIEGRERDLERERTVKAGGGEKVG